MHKRYRKVSNREKKLFIAEKPKECGLCGYKNPLAKLACCGKWICEDTIWNLMIARPLDEGCLFNHRHRTICGIHCAEGHEGRWQDCEICRDKFDDVMYTHYATNRFNFEPLADPPFTGTVHCCKCSKEIDLKNELLVKVDKGYMCRECGGFIGTAFEQIKKQAQAEELVIYSTVREECVVKTKKDPKKKKRKAVGG